MVYHDEHERRETKENGDLVQLVVCDHLVAVFDID
jgi:hypothetical protein